MEAEDDGRMGKKMTDEERKKLCAELRLPLLNAKWVCRKAADEIEWLAKENAQLKDIVHRMNCDLMNTQSDPLPREHQDPSKWVSREDMERAHKRARSDAEPAIEMDWSLSEPARRQLEEIERATIRPGDARLSNVVGPRHDASDPRYEISEVEGRFFVQRAGTDTVVAEFTDPPRPDASAGLTEAAISEDLVELANNEYWRDRQGPKMTDDRRKFENEKMWRTLKTVFRACATDRNAK